jgi:hypothetical protein
MAALAQAQAQAQGERLKKHGKVVIDAPSAKGLSKRPMLFQHPRASSASTSASTSTEVSRGQSVDRDGFLVPGIPVRALSVKKDKEKGKSPLRMGGEEAEASGVGEVESEMEGKNKTVRGFGCVCPEGHLLILRYFISLSIPSRPSRSGHWLPWRRVVYRNNTHNLGICMAGSTAVSHLQSYVQLGVGSSCNR